MWKVFLTLMETEKYAWLFLPLHFLHQYERLHVGLELINVKYLYRPVLIACQHILFFVYHAGDNK